MAGVILEKYRISHSYRIGLEIILCKEKGIFLAQKVLNHTNISATQVYFEKIISDEELARVYIAIHNVKSYKEIENKLNFMFYEEVEKLMKNEEKINKK